MFFKPILIKQTKTVLNFYKIFDLRCFISLQLSMFHFFFRFWSFVWLPFYLFFQNFPTDCQHFFWDVYLSRRALFIASFGPKTQTGWVKEHLTHNFIWMKRRYKDELVKMQPQAQLLFICLTKWVFFSFQRAHLGFIAQAFQFKSFACAGQSWVKGGGK